MNKIKNLRVGGMLLFLWVLSTSAHSQTFTPLKKDEKGSTYAADIPELCVFSKFKYNHIKLGICNEKGESQWFTDKKNIKVRRKENSIEYRITSPLLNNGELIIEVASFKLGFGYLLRATGANVPQGISLICATGDADRELADEEKNYKLTINPPVRSTFCAEANSITIYFGEEMKFTAIQMIVPQESEIRICDFNQMKNPLQFWESGKKTNRQLLAVKHPISETPFFIMCGRQRNSNSNYLSLPELFNLEYQKP